MIEYRGGYVDADFGVVDDLSLRLLFVLPADPHLLLRGLNGDHALFFILSPGADPVEEVEAMGKKDINLLLNENYPTWRGPRQDVVAMAKLDLGPERPRGDVAEIHLMPKWCVGLERKLDAVAKTATPLSG